MPQAIWNSTVIADSPVTEVVEGNHYFPPASIKREFYKNSETTSACGWKGLANYYSLDVQGQQNIDAAWYYADPKAEAENIRGHVAFWKGVEIVAGENDQANVSDAGSQCEI